MKTRLQVGELVECVRLSPNLGNKGAVGQVYRILWIAPKVRVTPGTGSHFLCCDCPTHKAYFNFSDVRKIGV